MLDLSLLAVRVDRKARPAGPPSVTGIPCSLETLTPLGSPSVYRHRARLFAGPWRPIGLSRGAFGRTRLERQTDPNVSPLAPLAPVSLIILQALLRQPLNLQLHDLRPSSHGESLQGAAGGGGDNVTIPSAGKNVRKEALPEMKWARPKTPG